MKIPVTQRHEILSQTKLKTLRYHTVKKPEISISPGLGLVPKCDSTTDGHTKSG